jgi:hypothetical protein
MFTQEQLAEINAAYDGALDRYNSIAAHKLIKSDANRDVLTRYLRSQNIAPYPDWTYEQVWSAALLHCADKLETVVVKSAEQLERERNARDTAAGRQRYIKDGDSNPDTQIDIKSPMQTISDLLTGKQHGETPAPDLKIQMPRWDHPLGEQPPAEVLKVLNNRSFSSEQMRSWLRNRARFEQEQRYPAPR